MRCTTPPHRLRVRSSAPPRRTSPTKACTTRSNGSRCSRHATTLPPRPTPPTPSRSLPQTMRPRLPPPRLPPPPPPYIYILHLHPHLTSTSASASTSHLPAISLPSPCHLPPISLPSSPPPLPAGEPGKARAVHHLRCYRVQPHRHRQLPHTRDRHRKARPRRCGVPHRSEPRHI